MNLARRLWRGDIALPTAFWGYMVVGGIVVNLITTAVALMLFASDAPVAIAATMLFLHAPYNLFMLVAVWRSAGHWRGRRKWAALAGPAALVWTAVTVAI